MLPETIGRYEVTRLAGAGGFATVYEGFDPRLEARVAIKVLGDNWSRDPEIRRRFRTEAVLMRRLSSERNVPGLVEVFDIDQTEGGQPFFVMPWAEAGTLAERAAAGSVSPGDLAPLVESLTQTLGHLHAAGVVHRDIKPSNLLIRSDGAPTAGSVVLAPGERLIVGDLGLAKDLSRESSELSMIGGTERYMAPEQKVFGGRIDHRADIYAVTALIDELLVPTRSDALQAAIRRGLAEAPADRFATMSEWRDALSTAMTATASGSAPAASTPPPRATAPATTAVPPPAAASSPTPPTVRRDSAQTRVLGGLGALIAAAAVAGAGLWFAVFGGSPISGPTSISSGETAEFTVDDAAPGSVVWTSPSGDSFTGDRLTVTGRLPGELSFTAEVDGDTHEHTVTVEESPDGPTISGPESLAPGTSATYQAIVPAGQQVYWIHPTLGRVDTPAITVTQDDDGVALGLVSIDDRGVERGSQLRIEASS